MAYRLENILSVVFCIELLTVSTTKVIVSKDVGKSSFPCIYYCYKKDVTFVLCTAFHI